MILGLFETHSIYVSDVNKLTKTFRCGECGLLLNRADNLIRHQNSTCGNLYVDKFEQGVKEFGHEKNIMIKILDFSRTAK